MSFGISRGYIHAVGYIPRNIAYIALAPNTPATELPVRPVHSRFWINFVPLEAMIASHPVLKIAVWYTISRTESTLTNEGHGPQSKSSNTREFPNELVCAPATPSG
jgi:hypothetical protein